MREEDISNNTEHELSKHWSVQVKSDTTEQH